MNKLKLHNLISSPWILVVLILLMLTSCATSIKFPVERPAEIDSKGANSIAILPFSSGNMLPFYFNHTADSKVIVNYIQEQFQKKILSSGFFTLIAAQGLPKDGKLNTDAAYDLYIHGNIYNFSNFVEKILVESQDKKKKDFSVCSSMMEHRGVSSRRSSRLGLLGSDVPLARHSPPR